MFLIGIIHESSGILKLLDSIKAIRGKDYIYVSSNKIKLNPTETILRSKHCYRYKKVVSRTYIGRTIDHKIRLVIDNVFNILPKESLDTCYTFGWDYNIDCASVASYTMHLVSLIPLGLRLNMEYLMTFLCSKVDSCNDPINGIIEGRWKSTFTGGLKPYEWMNGSHVFNERVKTAGPVKYGQCWVLADILSGMASFLGIKAKSVKIINCIIDLHDTQGIDFFKGACDSKSAYISKSQDQFNPFDMINEELLDYQASSDLSSDSSLDISKKGALFASCNDITICPNDLYDLNHYSDNKDNSSWNFHVWTEVLINDQWVIFDPSPLHDAPDNFKPYSIPNKYNIAGKFFGPVKINDINGSSGTAITSDHTRYIFSCINGQIRYWSPLKVDHKMVLYLSCIKERVPKVVYKSVDCTEEYRTASKTSFPISLSCKDKRVFINVDPKYLIGNYVVQICLLEGNTPLYIHREKIPGLSPKDMCFLKSESIKNYRLKADRLTFCLYDLSKRKLWSQCLDL
jgi:hypothetical protein